MEKPTALAAVCCGLRDKILGSDCQVFVEHWASYRSQGGRQQGICFPILAVISDMGLGKYTVPRLLEQPAYDFVSQTQYVSPCVRAAAEFT